MALRNHLFTPRPPHRHAPGATTGHTPGGGAASTAHQRRADQPRLPKPHPRVHGQTRHRPADGRAPKKQRRQRHRTHRSPDPRRHKRRRPQRALQHPAGAPARRHAALVLHPPRSRTQRRQTHRRRRPHRRRNLPPRHRRQQILHPPSPQLQTHPRPGCRHLPHGRPHPLRMQRPNQPGQPTRKLTAAVALERQAVLFKCSGKLWISARFGVDQIRSVAERAVERDGLMARRRSPYQCRLRAWRARRV